MRQIAFIFALAAVMGSTLAAAADQELLNMVMPDAKIVAGINVDSARNSAFGSFLLRQVSASDPDLAKFAAGTGFNPATDLREILMATAVQPASASPLDATMGAIGSGHPGLILARGTFDIAKISEFAKSDGHQTVETYSGATLMSGPDAKATYAMAFLENGGFLAGQIGDVRAALDRRTKTNTVDPKLLTKVNALSASQDAWAVSIAPMSPMGGAPATAAGPGNAPDSGSGMAFAGDLFKKIVQTSGGVKFGEQVLITSELVASDEKNATALGDVLKFLGGMVGMNAGGGKGGAPPAIVSLLQSLNVTTQGTSVNVKLSVPEADLEGLVQSLGVPARPRELKKI